MKLKKFFSFLLGGTLVAATAIPIAAVAVSCSSTPATDTFKANSGVINGVTTSGFKDVVSKLNLSNTTTLSSLTDTTLKDALSKTEYKDLTLTIQDGSSEVNGILRLKVTGSYNGKNYNDDIIISNFNHLNDSFTVTDVKLNNDKWFQQGGAYSGGSQKVDFGEENINLIEDATFTCDNSKLKWEDVKKDYTITLASSWNISEAKDKLENVKFIITHTKKEYKNSEWIDVSSKTLEQKVSTTISLPSFNDLLENVLNNVKFNDVSQYYASYFRGLFSYIAKQSRNDILEEASKKLFSSEFNYLENYDELKNAKIIFSTDPNDYSTDDVKGELTLKKVKLSSGNFETKMRDISFDKFKKIPEKFERRFNKEITISNRNSSGENKADYLWRLLGKALEDEIILVYNSQSEANNNSLTSDALKQKILPQVSGSWWPKSCIYDSARPELVNSVSFDRVNKNFDNFSLLGSSGRMEFGSFKANVTSNKFDYDSGLLNFGKGIIQVESINLWANTDYMTDVKLQKNDSGGVDLSFTVPIVITLVNNPNKIYQYTTFKTTFL